MLYICILKQTTQTIKKNEMETYRIKKKRNEFEKELSRIDGILCTSILMKRNGESVTSENGLFAMGTDEDIKIKHMNRTMLALELLNPSAKVLNEKEPEEVMVMIEESEYGFGKFSRWFMSNLYGRGHEVLNEELTFSMN
jgi:hypothetical protein